MNSEELELNNSFQSQLLLLINNYPILIPLERCAVILEIVEWMLVNYKKAA